MRKTLLLSSARSSVDLSSLQFLTLLHSVKFESIEMVAFPLGTAILVVHVNWIPEDGMTLDELRSWLHLSKFQYKVPGVLEGWLFRGDYDDRSEFPAAHLKSLGAELTGAMYAAWGTPFQSNVFYIDMINLRYPLVLLATGCLWERKRSLIPPRTVWVAI